MGGESLFIPKALPSILEAAGIQATEFRVPRAVGAVGFRV